jgi:hypothetical protein
VTLRGGGGDTVGVKVVPYNVRGIYHGLYVYAHCVCDEKSCGPFTALENFCCE